MSNLTFSEKLSLLRTRKNMNKKELAEATDIHWTSISKYERREAEPHLEGLKKIAVALGVSTDYLLFDDAEILPTINDKELLALAEKADSLEGPVKDTLKNLIQSYLDGQK